MFCYVAGPSLSRRVAPRTVFSGEKTSGQWKIIDDAETFLLAERFKVVFVFRAFDEAVVRLESLIRRQAGFLAGFERRSESLGLVVGSPDGSNLALLDKFRVGAQSFFQRRVWVVVVRLIQIDVVRLQAAQRIFRGAQDVGFRQPFLPIAHIHAILGGDDDLISI